MKIQFKIESYYKEDEEGKTKELYKLETTFDISETHFVTEESYSSSKEDLERDIQGYLEKKIYAW